MDEIDWGQIASGMPTPGTGPFAQRSAGAGVPPQAPMIPPSPISPEVIAKNLAARGVPPPPVDVTPPVEPIRMPDNNVGSSTWRQDMDTMMPGAAPGSVGAALTGKTVGAPMDIRSQPQVEGTASTDVSAQSKPQGGSFADALKGVKMPAGPELQRLGTPGAPRPTPIKGGDIVALLQALNVGGQAADGYKLPSTLGAAIRK